MLQQPSTVFASASASAAGSVPTLTPNFLALRRNPFPIIGRQRPSEEESRYFEWFRCRTVKRLQGSFESYFWDTLVLGASFDEPAVLHAALALGSAHKRESMAGSCLPPTMLRRRRRRNSNDQQPGSGDKGKGKEKATAADEDGMDDDDMEMVSVIDDEERFTLSQYNKSIRWLQPHFPTETRASIRVALITCMVFICLEFLRGRYHTGAEHLRSGMKLLAKLDEHNGGPLNQREHADEWLIEAFEKLNLQANLLGQGTLSLHCVGRHTSQVEPFPATFQNMREARKRLDYLLNDVAHLREQSRVHGRLWNDPGSEVSDLHHRRNNILADLEIWSRIYRVSRVTILSQMGRDGQASYLMLNMYHTMAVIMASTCLQPSGEDAFDAYTEPFSSILHQSLSLRSLAAAAVENQGGGDDDSQFIRSYGNSPFILDWGWIPPLFFVAVKCRDHQIRAQAILMLKSSMSKEGIWDSAMAAIVAEEVMRQEEGDHHHQPGTLGLRPRRISDLRVSLPDSVYEPTVIICWREGDNEGPGPGFSRVYNPRSRTWSDGDAPVRQGDPAPIEMSRRFSPEDQTAAAEAASLSVTQHRTGEEGDEDIYSAN